MNIGYETETVEFKKSTGELKEGIISLSSMLNKHSEGTVYFGVKNNGDVIGQEIGDRTLRDVSQMVASSIKPQLIPTITLELLDGCNVIKLNAQGSEKPYSAFGRYYIRSADEDRELWGVEEDYTLISNITPARTITIKSISKEELVLAIGERMEAPEPIVLSDKKGEIAQIDDYSYIETDLCYIYFDKDIKVESNIGTVINDIMKQLETNTGLKYYPLTRFVVQRDYCGNVLKTITTETIGFYDLPEDMQDLVLNRLLIKEHVDEIKDLSEKELDLYTIYKKEKNKWIKILDSKNHKMIQTTLILIFKLMILVDLGIQ